MSKSFYVVDCRRDSTFAELDDTLLTTLYRLPAERLQDFCDPIIVQFNDARSRSILNQDILPTFSPLPIVTARLRQLLEENFPDDVQFFDATVLFHKQKVTSEVFYALHHTKTYELFDLERSVCEYSPHARNPGEKVLMGFTSLTLLSDVSDAPDLFREASKSSRQFVSEHVKDICEKAKMRVSFFTMDEMFPDRT